MEFGMVLLCGLDPIHTKSSPHRRHQNPDSDSHSPEMTRDGTVVMPVRDSTIGRKGAATSPTRPSVWGISAERTAVPATQCRIELGLRPQSPKNGNFPSVRRRLSAILLWECPKSESGDWPQMCKSPPLAGLSASIRDGFSDRRTAWLGREDSNFDMANWKSDALGYPRGATKPVYVGIYILRNVEISRTVSNLRSPELRRGMGLSENNVPALLIMSPEFK
jgi:hypothetical protein